MRLVQLTAVAIIPLLTLFLTVTSAMLSTTFSPPPIASEMIY